MKFERIINLWKYRFLASVSHELLNSLNAVSKCYIKDRAETKKSDKSFRKNNLCLYFVFNKLLSGSGTQDSTISDSKLKPFKWTD